MIWQIAIAGLPLHITALGAARLYLWDLPQHAKHNKAR
jgi:hypothetical protein